MNTSYNSGHIPVNPCPAFKQTDPLNIFHRASMPANAMFAHPVAAAMPTRTISEGEKLSLTALISFVADSLGQPEENVAQGLNKTMEINNLADLTTCRYDAAVKFLVDQVPHPEAV